ncbi:MAG: hypothetical protein EA384_04235 [Spirochaetaceae bacterium]|nr:MAG: hypothetical protein EA384_04235 [Spirochaetaceae bacterium]
MTQSALDGLASLRAACIDTSSLIVCSKAGILERLAETCTLYTIRPVLVESGYRDAPVQLRPTPAGPAEVDDQLIACAIEVRLPVISEDRALLIKAADAGLAYYNALMMLNLLLLRGSLSPAAYGPHARLLLSAARYSAEVRQYGVAVYREILKRL